MSGSRRKETATAWMCIEREKFLISENSYFCASFSLRTIFFSSIETCDIFFVPSVAVRVFNHKVPQRFARSRKKRKAGKFDWEIFLCARGNCKRIQKENVKRLMASDFTIEMWSVKSDLSNGKSVWNGKKARKKVYRLPWISTQARQSRNSLTHSSAAP